METTESECVAALREAAERLGESPTKAQYEALGLTPVSATIQRVMGGWNEAKASAGLETNPSTGSRTKPKPDDLDLSVDTDWDEMSVDQRWYYRNREADNQYELERRARLREFIHDYKARSDGCCQCDEVDPACLDFHHVTGEKEMAVNKMVLYGYGEEDLLREIEKCELLCANCHRREHFSLDVPSNETLDERERLRAWASEIKRTAGCQRCGETDAICLQFHHVDEVEKRMGVGKMITDGFPETKIVAEVEKCEVLCANCHRKEHRL